MNVYCNFYTMDKDKFIVTWYATKNAKIKWELSVRYYIYKQIKKIVLS